MTSLDLEPAPPSPQVLEDDDAGAPATACSVCGRPLRAPTSVAARIGPKCFAKAATVYRTPGRRRRIVRALELELPFPQ